MTKTVKETLLTAWDELTWSEQSLVDSLEATIQQADRLKEHIADNRKAQDELKKHWKESFGTDIAD